VYCLGQCGAVSPDFCGLGATGPGRSSVVPYLEIDGGTLFTNHNVPAGTNTVNFTSSGVFGMHLLAPRYNWSIEARYMHISNAGLAKPNPGINTFQVRIGIGRFLPKKP
jgi:hypothetical protein